jgi:predicted Zn finger-like uncharacterized protein
MTMMKITCPHCAFSKTINSDKLPANTKKVSCPKCKQTFPLLQNSSAKQPDSKEDIYAPPKNDSPFDTHTAQFKYCSTCGQKINHKAEICPGCGVRVAPPPNSINKVALVLLTFFFGGIGGHKFYQKKYLQGILYFLFFWTYIPALIAFIEFFIYIFTSEEKLRQRYPEGSSSAAIIAICLSFVGIAMIGILAAIAIPNFIAYRERSFQLTATNNLEACHADAETYISAHGTYPTSIDDFRCNVSENISLYYLPLGPEKYQIVSYHNQGEKAFLLSNDDPQVKESTREETMKQLEESFGSSVLGPDFHFIN